MKIAIDVMGGDNAPISNIKGVFSYLSKNNDNNTELFLVGDKQVIQKTISQEKYNRHDNVHILHSSQTISNDDNIKKIHKIKPDSSIVKCVTLIKDKKVDAAISAGNTGALLSSSLFLLNTIEHIKRPALAPYIPSNKGNIILCDAGANINTKPIHILQHAIMSAEYFKLLHDKKNPRIGLINIGTEENKGPDLYKDSYKLLKKYLNNFIGFVESRDILSGKVDIIISDGFTGNIMLKLIEGIFGNFHDLLDNTNTTINDKFKEKLLYEKHGGAPLLGINGIVIKCHGSSSFLSIENSIKQVEKLYKTKLIEQIAAQTAHTLETLVKKTID